MREFFVYEWHGIRFPTFAETSATRLADADFYNKYYCALFDRYSGYEALDAHWRKTKEEAAEWIASNLPDGGRVLSMRDTELVALSGKLWPYRREGGAIALISASYLDDSWWRELIQSSKDIIKSLLARLGCYERGQFWGWMRSRSEYRALMAAAGCKSLDDGFIVTPHQRTYWIRGRTTEKSALVQ